MIDVVFVNLGFKEFKGLHIYGASSSASRNTEIDGADQLRGVGFAWFSSFWIDENGGLKN